MPSEAITTHYHLKQFLACYFFPEFEAQYGRPEAAIKAYLEANRPEEVRACLNELDDFIKSSADLGDERVETILWTTYGCFYRPASNNLLCYMWLQRVRRQLANHLRD